MNHLFRTTLFATLILLIFSAGFIVSAQTPDSAVFLSRQPLVDTVIAPVKTTKQQGDGFSFDLLSSIYICHKVDLVEQINLNYRYKNLDIFASLGYSKTTSEENTDLIHRLQSETQLELRKDMRFTTEVRDLTPAIGFNYEFNSNHSVGFRYYPYMFRKGHYIEEIDIAVAVDGEHYDDTHKLADCTSYPGTTQRTNLYYNGNIGKLNIDFNFDYYNGGLLDSTVHNELSKLHESRKVHTINPISYNMLASKLVLTYPVLGGEFSLGSEYAKSEHNDDYLNPENFVPTTYNTIREHNAATFAGYSRKLPFGSFSAGMRYEHTDLSYFDNDEYNGEKSRKYDHFLPNASLNAVVGPLQMNLSYDAKSRRPTYHLLSSASLYLGRYGISQGNPMLKPQINQNISFAATWKFMQLFVNCQIFKDAIISSATSQPDLPNIIVLRYINYSKKFPLIKAMLSANPTIGVWTPHISLGVQKQWLAIPYMGQDVELKNPVPLLSLGSTFSFPKGFMLNVEYNFQGKGHVLAFERVEPIHQIDVFLRKSFLNNTLSIELRGVDLFALRHEKVHLYSGKYELIQGTRLDSNEFIVTIRYNFNSAKSRYKGTGAGEREKGRF